MTFWAKYKRYKGLCIVKPEGWVKLLIRIRERIKIVYITIVFISALVGFIITAVLAHVTWALAQEWVLSIRTAKTVTWTLTREWALAQDTMVISSLHMIHMYIIHLYMYVHVQYTFSHFGCVHATCRG